MNQNLADLILHEFIKAVFAAIGASKQNRCVSFSL